jgi:hypothetical protein
VERPAPGRDEGGDRGSVGEVEPPDVDGVVAVVAVMSAAVRLPASVLRTASVTSAPASARARAVSIPIPDEEPVTIARLPLRSIPASTSAAVDSNPNGVVIRAVVVAVVMAPLCAGFVR